MCSALSALIDRAFENAARDFGESLRVMRPYRNRNEGYCEANLVEYFSSALRKEGFRPFLELPISRGRIDGLFFKHGTFLLLEAKQLYRESIAYIEADLKRLAALDLAALLKQYGNSIPLESILEIALCDCWKESELKMWQASPFLARYSICERQIPQGGEGRPYTWLMAYRQRSVSL